jgi:hypothetical protein
MDFELEFNSEGEEEFDSEKIMSPISPQTLDKFDIYKNVTLNKIKHNFFGNIYDVNLPNFDHHKEASDEWLDIKLFSSYLATILAFYNRNMQLKNNYVCLYNLVENMNLLEYFIAIDFTNWNIRIPITTVDWINNNCAQNDSISLFILPIRLEFINDNVDLSSNITCQLENPLQPDITYFDKNMYSAHSNLIIIDKVLKKIEFYEPHGNQIGISNASLFNIQTILDKTIRSLLPFTAEYTFINVSNICPYGLGAQSIQNQRFNVGHCLAWSLYFIFLRLYNQSITEELLKEDNVFQSTTEILNHFVTTTSDSFILNSNIRKFISFLKELSNENLLINLNVHTNLKDVVYIDLIDQKLIDTQIVYSRIKQLTQAFCKKQLMFSKTDTFIIFEEIVSYRRFPNFHKIFIKSFVDYIKDNMICFIHYERVSKILSNTLLITKLQNEELIIKQNITSYINNVLRKSIIDMTLDFDTIILHRFLEDKFYNTFFKYLVETLLDNIFLNYSALEL